MQIWWHRPWLQWWENVSAPDKPGDMLAQACDSDHTTAHKTTTDALTKHSSTAQTDSKPVSSDRIGAYPATLETSGCARSLDWSWRRLMLVMSYRNTVVMLTPDLRVRLVFAPFSSSFERIPSPSRMKLCHEILETISYHMVKIRSLYLTCLALVPGCNGQTNRQTELR